MKNKVFKNFFFLSAISIIITTIMISFIMYNGFYNDMKAEVRQEARYIAEAVNFNGENYLKEISRITEDRITLIGTDGAVIFDNRQKPEKMENHLDRPEVAEAIETGTGETARMSDTLGTNTFYFAVKTNNGSIVRVASTTSNVYFAVAENLPYMIIICIVMLLITSVLAKRQTRGIVSPINNLDLENPLSNEVYEEFSPLLRKLEQQNKLIEKTVGTLKKEREEFKSITQNMSEGLIVLNSSGQMLIVNERASEIFGKTAEGHYLTLNRSAEFRDVAEKALNGIAAESKLMHGGRIYHLVAMPNMPGESKKSGRQNIVANEAVKPQGVVVLALDITEKEETDSIRREFSANVSHELKTPLTSILGYAEIIREGIAKPEDINRFASKIYEEAQRMILLVDDIMKLSKLDEGATALAESTFDLREVCSSVAERLRTKAKELDVEIVLELSKQPIEITGVMALIDEMIYNLCENAIKYNKAGGMVVIKNSAEPKSVIIADTGIGIPKQDHARIFERFYRVDKSHSKDTGGTGLGLSIVKHIAKQQNATIKLDSELEKGTTIEIQF